MIKANELRIGNWLFVPGVNRHVKVTAIFSTHFRCEDSDGTLFEESVRVNYHPIPLTPEVLEKSGFVYDLNLGEYKHRGLSFVYLRAADDYKVIWVTSADSDETLCSVKSLHQLQNLFFCLTGEELPYQQLNP